MKKNIFTKLMAFFIALALAVPVTSFHSTPVTAYAASVALSAKTKTIIMGSTYTFTVKNATNVKSKSWSSNKTSIAKVNGQGKVTPVAAGKATISCKVLFNDGTSQTLTATVTVKNRIPSTKVTLDADRGTLNAISMKVGETYQLKFTKEPSNTTDYAYFVIADPDYASVTTSGLITAKKAGITMVEARCGINASNAKQLTNTVTDRLYIYIEAADGTENTEDVTPTPTPETGRPIVTNVSLVSSKELKIDFSSPVQESSVIDSNGDLVSGTVTIGETSEATKFISLTPKLSNDKKSLYLEASGKFEGTYVITVSELIKNTGGTAVTPYTVQKSLKDEVGPSYVTTTVDNTGYISTIEFNEALDISGLSVYSVTGTSNTTLKAYLTSAENYVLSADKKSLSIDLSSCGVTSANVMVSITGIKDILGNASNPFTLNARVKIDATQKPNATLVSVTRTSKNIMTATFSKAIQVAGYAYIGDEYVTGIVDSKDDKKVNYVITNTALTGTQVVKLNGWMSYNATSMQSSDVTRGVKFTLDTTAPALIGYTLTSTTENKVPVLKLTLTYNKEVTLIDGSGKMNVKIKSSSDNVYNKQLAYTASAKSKVVTITFTNQTNENGTYTFSIPASLVMDQYENASVAATINLSKQTSNSSQLPAPESVSQDTDSPELIYVKFSAKLDVATATKTTNYRVGTNAYPTSATIVSQDDRSATVELKFANNAIPTTANYPVTIKGIKGYNNSYGEMSEYNVIIPLVENAAPIYQSAKLTSAYSIVLTFGENITGTVDLTVYDGNNIVGSAYTISDNQIYITLTQDITSKAYIMFHENNLKDASNNTANIKLNTKLAVTKSY